MKKLALILAFGVLASCGADGDPIAPDTTDYSTRAGDPMAAG